MDFLIDVERYKHSSDFTLSRVYLDGQFECFGLEDERRDVKVMHETRIPEGEYRVTLRTFGSHHEKYKVKFPGFHRGMLWVRDIPGFRDILIHIGNTEKDTSGCLLVGSWPNEDAGTIVHSTSAYEKLYKKVIDAIDSKREVKIKYRSV